MKAITQDRYGGPDVLEFRDLDRPAPKDNEVLIEVRAAGLHRGDWHIMTGLPYLIRLVVPTLGLRKPKVPVLGMDVAGRVEAVGAQVTRFRPGDEVFGWADGSFAEYACAAENQLAAKPTSSQLRAGGGRAHLRVRRPPSRRNPGELQQGQKVLVIGAAGAVGSFAVQLAKAFGAQVTGVASTTQIDLVRSIGADEVIDYTRDRHHRRDPTVGPHHRHRGPPDPVTTAAGPHPQRNAGHRRRRRGRTVDGRLPSATFARPLLSRFVGQRLRMLASKENQEDLQTLRDLIEAGKLTPRHRQDLPAGRRP